MRRTRSLPLVLVHVALAIGVDDAHALEQRSKLRMLGMLFKYLVELLLVNEFQAVLRRHPTQHGHQMSAMLSVADTLTGQSCPNGLRILAHRPQRPVDRTSSDDRT